ncbi:MAG: polyprenyl diphosphate synthase [Advenella sp.]|jgi:undecaprenyl diphosphate synthase|nr:polyprenyl diphosphate synthase [Advenella sp.]
MILSSTLDIPETHGVPKHIAIIMDGNGRWATDRKLPRTAGHVRGVQAVRKVVEHCVKSGVSYLTLFAFSSENWRRPKDEVSLLMRLFIRTLEREVKRLNKNGICLKVVGDLSQFEPKLQQLILQSQEKTSTNTTMILTIAANYGGRWDILQAMRRLVAENPQAVHSPELINEQLFNSYLAMSWAPEPDLFIRTGGESRISNFMIWQLAYTELYFTNTYWPNFKEEDLELAFEWYRSRERRFGRTSAQLKTK